MAIIKPFVAIRPDTDVADRVAALPYDVYNRAEAAEEVRREPLSDLSVQPHLFFQIFLLIRLLSCRKNHILPLLCLLTYTVLLTDYSSFFPP